MRILSRSSYSGWGSHFPDPQLWRSFFFCWLVTNCTDSAVSFYGQLRQNESKKIKTEVTEENGRLLELITKYNWTLINLCTIIEMMESVVWRTTPGRTGGCPGCSKKWERNNISIRPLKTVIIFTCSSGKFLLVPYEWLRNTHLFVAHCPSMLLILKFV